ncbi:MAG: TetR/AcrR family transcriptional regulator [Pseudomonadota bacterium]
MADKGTKERLIETAMELIWQSSYRSVSVEEICKNSDVNKGSFYHFFPSKTDLAVAAIEQYYIDSKPIFDEIFDISNEPIERFDKLVNLILVHQKETKKRYGHVCGCPFASLGSEMAGQDEVIRKKIQNTIGKYKSEYYQQAIQDMVDEGMLPKTTDVKSKAQEVYSYLLGQVMLARIQNDLKPLNKSLKNGLYEILGVSLESA